MESPDRKRQKVLKAKKTMPTSCRKQLEILNKSKNVEVSKATTGINIPNGHNQKKMFSENKENVKLMKASEQINENGCVALERHTALLEQVKHWIRQEVYMINCNLFDKKLNELNERIGKTQCKNKHEAIAGELFVKIRRLQRRIKTVLSSQGDCLEPKTLPSNTVCKVTDAEAMNSSVTQKSVKSLSKRMPSVNPNPFNKSSEKASTRVNLSSACVEFVSESNTDDVMFISVEKPNLTTPITSDPTEIGKNTSRKFSNSPNTIIEVEAVKKKLDFVIDLTREGLSTYSIGPALSRFPIVPSAEDQAFNTGAFGGQSRSRLQLVGTKPLTRRKKSPVREKRKPSGTNCTLEEDNQAATGYRSEIFQELD
ncbi:activating transcription factor 7-interacting protein 2 isoform X2 [Mesocricetus auratus]|uniref:Activating transcription factor 7-interacting protein 2 isoform X2 n=1 Tax=Mesocricetus auratus TaxID=10036 RepID=A0ABM2XMT8_MESAU|nr:activating transcription factor 7-interacting protein 2 isoform X2 [Mesocricetus auratus]